MRKAGTHAAPAGPERTVTHTRVKSGVEPSALLTYNQGRSGEGSRDTRMSDERRYDDGEVAEILERAARAELAMPPGAGRHGMTLAELQRIGQEAGIAPELVARAAASLDQAPAVPALALQRERVLGVPVGVAREYELPRPLDDDEWQRLVSAFRHTFRAPGRVSSDLGLREWRNGNLVARIEPGDEGAVLRFSTRKSEAGSVAFAGVAAIIAIVALVVLGLTGSVDGMVAPGIFAALTGGAFAAGALRFPAWAGERERQFEQLARQARRLAAAPAAEADPD